MYKSIAVFFSTMVLASLQAFAAETTAIHSIKTCNVTFDLGKTTFKEQKLKNCIQTILNKNEVKDISIIASASTGGSAAYNASFIINYNRDYL